MFEKKKGALAEAEVDIAAYAPKNYEKVKKKIALELLPAGSLNISLSLYLVQTNKNEEEGNGEFGMQRTLTKKEKDSKDEKGWVAGLKDQLKQLKQQQEKQYGDIQYDIQKA